ncbi:MAG: hypothetical protein Phyf2KO_18670 [Phycisphaerales bacterium]
MGLVGETDLNTVTIPLRLNKSVAQRISIQQQADARSESRRKPRFKLAPGKRISLDFERADGRVTAEGLLRDISESGAGLWIGTFMHPETRCWLVLGEPGGSDIEIEGIVRWCKHFAHSVHEIGIQLIDANPDVMAATLAGQTTDLASDLADVLTMVHTALADIRQCAEKGLTAEQTQNLIAKLEDISKKDN